MKPWEKTYQKPSGPWDKFATPEPAPSSGPTTRRPGRTDSTKRAQLEAQLAEQQASAPSLHPLDALREPIRAISRGLVAPGRGIVGLGALAEAPVNVLGTMAAGRPVRGPLTAAYEALSPPEFRAQGLGEEIMDFVGENLGAGMGVFGAGQRLAQSTGPVAQRVGQVLTDSPRAEAGAAVLGGVGAGAGGELAEEMGLPREVGQVVGGLAFGIGGSAAAGGFRQRSTSLPEVDAMGAVTPPMQTPQVADTPYAPGAFHQVNQSDPLALAREMGIVIPPSTAVSKGGPTTGVFRESLSGPSRVQARFVLENARRLNDRAARMLGLPGGSRLSAKNYELARQPHYAVYDELRDTVRVLEEDPQLVAQASQIGEEILGNPLLRNFEEASTVARLRDIMVEVTQQNLPTPQVIEAIRWLRSKAVSLQNRANDPKADEVADGYIGFATALEDALERSATRYGDPTLVDRFRQARTEIAKSYDLESITRGESLDLSKLERIGEKRPLTGELAALRDVAVHFGPETKWAPGVRVPNPETITLFGQGKRLFQRSTVPHMSRSLMSDDFQNQYGTTSGQIGPDSPLGEAYFPQESGFPKPPPAGPQGPGAGPVDFTPPSGVPPGRVFRGGLDMELLPDPVPGAVDLPPATGRPVRPDDLGLAGDMPVDGVPFRVPNAEPPETALGLANELEGALPFSRPALPPEAAVGGRLALDEPLPSPTPGSGLADDLVPPLSDIELLDLLLQADNPPGIDLNPRPPRRPPPDEPPAAAEAGSSPTPRQGGGGGLADELTLADDIGPAPARRDLELAPEIPRGQTAEQVTVRRGAPAGALRGKHVPENATIIYQGAEGDPSRYLVLEERNGRLQTRSINTEKFKAENPEARGAAKDLYLRAADEAAERGLPWDTDSSIKEGAFYALDSLVNSGDLVIPGWEGIRQQILDIFATGDSAARNPAGDVPWAKDIRRGSR